MQEGYAFFLMTENRCGIRENKSSAEQGTGPKEYDFDLQGEGHSQSF